jgi:hypothetical protein
VERWFIPSLTFSAFSLYWLFVFQQGQATIPTVERPAQIVITEPIQVFMYAGDRFLAANIESVRATAASATETENNHFRRRAHTVVSRLNPCHEDNYWVGNASLTWGGEEGLGLELLGNALRCRFWDEWPAFFYGFNQNFFFHNIPEATRVLELAAQRSSANAAVFRNFSIMLAAGEIDDTRAALKMLKREHDQADDPKLRKMLNKRVVRLSGLLTLRDAQIAFETRFNRPLTQPQELLDSGVLEGYPEDPLGLGYEFHDQAFHLKKMKVQ